MSICAYYQLFRVDIMKINGVMTTILLNRQLLIG